MANPKEVGEIRTRQGLAKADQVLVRGYDLCEDLIGKLDIGELLFLLIQGRWPSASEGKMLNALLVALAEDGVAPSTLAARLTLRGAPESLQGAVAAGILGAGGAFLGTSERAAKMLQEALRSLPDPSPEDIAQAAEAVVARYHEEKAIIPGIGHRRHKGGDPRAERLLQVAQALQTNGSHTALIQAIQVRAEAVWQRPLPLNITGAIAAIASDLGFSWQVAKAFAILGRATGIIGHLAEEMEQPTATQVMDLIMAHVVYQPNS